MSLKEKVMIANLSISQWTARKYDKKVSLEIEAIHNTKEAGRFNKLLLQSNTLKEISKIVTKVRTYHYENTLPWGDNGDRILPTEKYFDYVTNIGQLKIEHQQLIDVFITEYKEEKEKAKIRLNTMYKEQDYPNEKQLKHKFNILITFLPIAESVDLRVNLSEEITNTIKQQITQELQNRVENATNEMLNRLKQAINHMWEKLHIPNEIFRDSLVSNIQQLTETLPLLNFNKDTRVKNAIELAKKLIVDPDKLRWNVKFRKEIAQKAKQILDNI